MTEWEERKNCVEGEVWGVVIVKPAGCRKKNSSFQKWNLPRGVLISRDVVETNRQ